MKKIDGLLKKVELFEKLAIYSDRKSFLRTLAQQNTITPDIKQKLESLLKDISAIKPSSTELQNQLMSAIRGDLDPVALRTAVITARDTIPTATNKPQWDKAQQLLGMLQNPAPDQSEEQVMNMPADHVSGHKPAQFNQGVKDVQIFLNKALAKDVGGQASILSIDTDGKWGPETAKALKNWGDKNNLSGIPLTAVFTAAQAQATTNVPHPNLDTARRTS